MRLLAAAALSAVATTPCLASAWTQPAGGGQVIIKYEDVRATEGFDASGARVGLPAARSDRFASVFAEYGLTPRLTVRLKTDVQSGRDAFVDYAGRGPLELGLNWQVHRGPATVVAVYAGIADGGEGRNAGFSRPAGADLDGEVRLAVGRSFGDLPGPFAGRGGEGAFVEVQAARRVRRALPDEVRVDLTGGVSPRRDWLLLTQVYAGATDDGGARWMNLETSAVRRFGPWRVQAGWRTALAGRDVAAPQGPVVGLWRQF